VSTVTGSQARGYEMPVSPMARLRQTPHMAFPVGRPMRCGPHRRIRQHV